MVHIGCIKKHADLCIKKYAEVGMFFLLRVVYHVLVGQKHYSRFSLLRDRARKSKHIKNENLNERNMFYV